MQIAPTSPLAPSTHGFAYLEILEVTGANSLTVKGDLTWMLNGDERFWIFAPPSVDAQTGAIRGTYTGSTFKPAKCDSRYLWAQYRYMPPMAGYEVNPGTPGIYGKQPGTNAAGTYHAWNRQYDPGTGRWTTPDPAASPWGNLWDYASGIPVSSSDPSGLNLKPKKTEEMRPTGEELAIELAYESLLVKLKAGCDNCDCRWCPRESCERDATLIATLISGIVEEIKAEEGGIGARGWLGNILKDWVSPLGSHKCEDWQKQLDDKFSEALEKPENSLLCKHKISTHKAYEAFPGVHNLDHVYFAITICGVMVPVDPWSSGYANGSKAIDPYRPFRSEPKITDSEGQKRRDEAAERARTQRLASEYLD